MADMSVGEAMAKCGPGELTREDPGHQPREDGIRVAVTEEFLEGIVAVGSVVTSAGTLAHFSE